MAHLEFLYIRIYLHYSSALRSLAPIQPAFIPWIPHPSTRELMQLAQSGKAFDFLHDEPDLYTLDDGEPI